MAEELNERIAKFLAKALAVMCVRNTSLEGIHAGICPVTHTGDYSDVVVIDATGRRIPWTRVSRIDDDEMRDLMRQVVNRLYTAHLYIDDPGLNGVLGWAEMLAKRWDEPKLDETTMEDIRRTRELQRMYQSNGE
ncbi:MAG: hypothetical protein OXF88_21090 [Rhodobacteraceae bacterium]|nr:hypothetical protein [Paracoccaceae bacterium]MCY4138095.1 hypothetical protein [Paracoccaceae bacterium]